MASRSTSEARARVALDPTPFEGGAKAIIAAADNMSSTITTAFVAAGVAILAAFGVDSLKSIVNQASAIITLGEDMANAGKRAGIAAGQFYLFHNAVEKGLNLKTVANLIGENAEVLNKSANTFRDVAIKLWVVGEKIRGFWLGLMDRVAPVLSRILDGALGASLVQAGEWFGDKIADAVAVVYQLAEDGKLWETMKQGFKLAIDYGAERLIWVASTFSDLLNIAIQGGFNAALIFAATQWNKFSADAAKTLGQAIGSSLYDAMADLLGFFYNLHDTISTLLNEVGLRSDEELKRFKKEHYDEVEGMHATARASNKPIEVEPFDIGKNIAQALARNQFKPSEDLADSMANFSKVVEDALGRYQEGERNSPTTTFENNQRRTAFGADSLATIGGGGNLFTGFILLDVQRSQLQELRSINHKLDWRQEGAQSSPLVGSQDSGIGISRSQRGNVTNGSN